MCLACESMPSDRGVRADEQRQRPRVVSRDGRLMFDTTTQRAASTGKHVHPSWRFRPCHAPPLPAEDCLPPSTSTSTYWRASALCHPSQASSEPVPPVSRPPKPTCIDASTYFVHKRPQWMYRKLFRSRTFVLRRARPPTPKHPESHPRPSVRDPRPPTNQPLLVHLNL